MTTISLIAAVDELGGIGKNNALLCYLPADLHYFKSQTVGKPIIMGRKTFTSIGKPLPGRTNIVLSRQIDPIDGVSLFHSLEEALAATQTAEEVMIIGGAQIYKQAFSLADRLYITKIHARFAADVFFPEINTQEWVCVQETLKASDEKNAYAMTFIIYEKANNSLVIR